MTPQEFIISYLKSKGFELRYKKHFPTFVRFVKQRNPNVSYILRDINKLKNTKVVNDVDQPFYNAKLNTIHTNIDSPYTSHEFGHAISESITPFERDNVFNKENPIYDFKLDVQGNMYPFSYPIFRKNRQYQQLAQKYPNYDNEVAYHYHEGNKTLNGHDASPSEAYADLVKLRYDLFESKIFDSRTTDIFTKDHLLKFKKSKQYKENKRLFNNFTDDQIVQMMNEVAQNDTPQDNQNLYAKNGSKLIPKKFKQLK